MDGNLKVSFYSETGTKKRNGGRSDHPYPIVGKIAIGHGIAQFSTKLKVEERLWHVKSGRATGKSHAAVRLNREINSINLSIHRHCREISERTGTVTAAEVKNAFQGIASAQTTLLALFGDVMRDFQARIGIDRAKGTYIQHEILYKQIGHFLREKYRVEDIPLTELDLPFIEALDFYFRVDRRMKPRTVRARIVLLNKIVRPALHRNLISRPPFEGFELERPEVRDRSLTSEQLERLISTPLESSTQRFIRDLFVFAAFTGISHADLKKLSWSDIVTADDGSRWIVLNRQKTGTTSCIPLLDIPLRILDRYADTEFAGTDGRVFRMTTVTNMDVQLKKIARAAGIDRPVSYHQSRHSFATEVCLSQGVPIETVSRMLGHRDIATTQIYAKITRTKIDEDMTHLEKRMGIRKRMKCAPCPARSLPNPSRAITRQSDGNRLSIRLIRR